MLAAALLAVAFALALPCRAMAATDPIVGEGDEPCASFAPRPTWDSFTYSENGCTWLCKEYNGAGSIYEAVVYGVEVDSGDMPSLHVPSTVEYQGRELSVVGLISYGEATCEDEEYQPWPKYSTNEHYSDAFRVSGGGGNGNIETIAIPGTVRFIGVRCFAGFSNLGVVYFDGTSGLESIECGAFLACKRLEDFSSASGLNGLTIPSSVSYIGPVAFAKCESIVAATLPESSQIADDIFFMGCPSLRRINNAPAHLLLSDAPLEEVTFASGIEVVDGIDVLREYLDKRLAYEAGDYIGSSVTGMTLRSVAISQGTIKIGYGAFSGFVNLEKVELPSTITAIGQSAFRGCESLKSINLPESLEHIYDYAFGDCKSLAIEVVHPGMLYNQWLGSGITGITFTNTKGTLHMDEDLLNPVMSYETLEWNWDNAEVRADLFSGCENLQYINVAGGSRDTIWSEDGVLYAARVDSTGWFSDEEKGKGTDCLIKMPAGRTGSYTIAPFVRSVYPLAFEDSGLSEVHIPVTVEKMLWDWSNSTSYFYAFTGMHDGTKAYYVKNSYIGSQVNYNRYYRSASNVEYVEEPGPPLRITYKLDGGLNAAANPETVEGGSSVTLQSPTKLGGYVFDGWYHKGDDDSEEKLLEDGVLTPRKSELVNGVTVTARWSKKSFFSDARASDSANHGVEVEWMGTSGISQGWLMPDGTREFRGLQSVARCDFAAFLYRLADLTDDGERNDSPKLTDAEVAEVLAGVSDCTPRTDHAMEVAWMISSGISKGWTNRDGSVSFRPRANVARQDMAAFLYRFADLADDGEQNKSLEMGTETVTFSDVEHGDAANHADEVEWLASIGVTKGWQMKDGTFQFRGTKTVARQDMAAFLYRLNEYLQS